MITLTTDFGEGSPYAAQIKAAVLSVNPEASLVDITHSIAPQDVRHGAIVLADTAPHFPPGTIHICVVDPGVGTSRKIVYASIGQQRFIAPDNGLLSLLAGAQPIHQIVALESARYWRPGVSKTFHGRDIMAPVAAHLTLGVDPEQLGARLPSVIQLSWPVVERAADSLTGTVLIVDHFGNLITNVTRSMLPDEIDLSTVHASCDDRSLLPLVDAYGQADSGTAIALFGSGNRLEIAVTNGNASKVLAARVGSRVQLSWR